MDFVKNLSMYTVVLFLTRKRLLNFCQSQSAVARCIILYIYHYTIIYYLVFHYMRLYYIYALMWYYTMIYYAYRTMILYYYVRMWCDTVILCADTFKRIFAADRKGKCDLLCNTEKVNIIYSQKYSKLFYINTWQNKKSVL